MRRMSNASASHLLRRRSNLSTTPTRKVIPVLTLEEIEKRREKEAQERALIDKEILKAKLTDFYNLYAPEKISNVEYWVEYSQGT